MIGLRSGMGASGPLQGLQNTQEKVACPVNNQPWGFPCNAYTSAAVHIHQKLRPDAG